MRELSLCALNIHGATSKLEQSVLIHFFAKYDIVSLSELKHSYPITLPGFSFIRSRINPEHIQRGGVGVFIKHYLWQHVHNISTLDDQVWFSINVHLDVCIYHLVTHDTIQCNLLLQYNNIAKIAIIYLS